jgi:hypothetical protein
MESDELQAQIQSRDRNAPIELAVRLIEKRIAIIRGIAVN